MQNLRTLLASCALCATLTACGESAPAITAPEGAEFDNGSGFGAGHSYAPADNGSSFGSGHIADGFTTTNTAPVFSETASEDSTTTSVQNGFGFGGGH